MIAQGRNSMPAFRQFAAAETDARSSRTCTSPPTPSTVDAVADRPRRSLHDRWLHGFLDPDGVPAIAPPWGTLNAIDLVSGELLWKVPLGEYPQLVAKGIRNTGRMNFGGAVATAGGVVFVAATADEKIRAFENTFGPRAVGVPAACRRLRDAERLHDRRPRVRGDRRRRRRQERDEVRRLRSSRLRCRMAADTSQPNANATPLWRIGLDRALRRHDVERLGAHERRAPIHRRGWRDRRPHGREQREHEFVPVHAARVRRLRARAGDDDRSSHESGHPDQERGAAGPDDGQKLRVFAGRVNGPQVEIRRYYKG